MKGYWQSYYFRCLGGRIAVWLAAMAFICLLYTLACYYSFLWHPDAWASWEAKTHSTLATASHYIPAQKSLLSRVRFSRPDDYSLFYWHVMTVTWWACLLATPALIFAALVSLRRFTCNREAIAGIRDGLMEVARVRHRSRSRFDLPNHPYFTRNELGIAPVRVSLSPAFEILLLPLAISLWMLDSGACALGIAAPDAGCNFASQIYHYVMPILVPAAMALVAFTVVKTWAYFVVIRDNHAR